MATGNPKTEKSPQTTHDLFTRRAEKVAWLIVLGLAVELIGMFWSGRPVWEIAVQAIADLLIAGGVGFELWFERVARVAGDALQAEAKKSVAEANKAAEEANARASEADLKRAKLELRLQPRSFNQEQWDLIQALRGKFSAVNIAYETDGETSWFAEQVRQALVAAKISVRMYERPPHIHTFGTMIFEPSGFDGAKPRSTGPLMEIFEKSDVRTALAFTMQIPNDILALIANREMPVSGKPSPPSLSQPMIILGGRFVLPPNASAPKAPDAG